MSHRRLLGFSALLAAGVLAVLLARKDAQAYVPRLTFAELASRSKYVIGGEVIELTSYRAPFHDLGEVIFTDVKIRIETVLRGRPEGEEITVQLLGGRIGEEWQSCAESPVYQAGEKTLVFLREYNGKLWNTGWFQGKYNLLHEGSVVKGREGFPIPADVALSTVRGWVERYPYTSPSTSSVPKPSGTVPSGTGSGTPGAPGSGGSR